MSKAGVCAGGRLDDELAAALEPWLQDALNHPVRREILRNMHQAESGCSVTEIVGKLPPLTCEEVSYHLRVLQAAGSIFVDGTRPAVGGRDVLYRSALLGDAGALAVLRAMESSDLECRQKVREIRSSSLLTMFRVPRPSPTLQLGKRPGRKSKPGE